MNPLSTLRFGILFAAFVLSFINCAQSATEDASSPAATVSVKDGQVIAFLGDSITAQGWDLPYGYIHLVVDGLNTIGIHVKPIPAGISGQTSREMLARVKWDIISKKPDWMTLSCGVNDIARGESGVDLEHYKENITSIVDQCQAAGIHVLIFTATRIGEADTDNNKKLAAYNDFLRELAGEKHCVLADLNAAEQAALAELHADPNKKYLTIDGVHMNPHGDRMMARGILKAIGVDDQSLARVEQQWLDGPNLGQAEYSLSFKGAVPITLRESDALEAIAATRNQTAADLLNSLFVADIAQVIKCEKETPSTVAALQAAAQKNFATDVAALLKKEASGAAAR